MAVLLSKIILICAHSENSYTLMNHFDVLKSLTSIWEGTFKIPLRSLRELNPNPEKRRYMTVPERLNVALNILTDEQE